VASVYLNRGTLLPPRFAPVSLEIRARKSSRSSSLACDISFTVQVTSFDGIRRMVESGLGMAVLPDGAGLPEVVNSQLGVIPLIDAWAKRKLLVGVRDASALTLAARNMLANLTGVPAKARTRGKKS
jgi:DNA-binding transcriptional LysR family regulator